MHNDGPEHETSSTASTRLHILIMALCCVIPIAIVAVLLFANVGTSFLPYLLVVLCPLLMLLMYLPQMLPRKKTLKEN